MGWGTCSLCVGGGEGLRGGVEAGAPYRLFFLGVGVCVRWGQGESGECTDERVKHSTCWASKEER